MIEILTENGALDIDQAQKVKYNIQVSDIFNLSESKASYLDSINIPKTANNVKILNGLGIVGDQSNAPYTKFKAQLKYFGHIIINDGWLIVKETSSEYKLSIIDGIIDFFKRIEGRKIGIDLDLSAAEHDKNMNNVLASQSNNIYRYLIADYGGKALSENNRINIDYLTPSLSVPYLLNAVENYTGYKFTGSILESNDVKGLWLTYPKPPKEVGTETLELVFKGYGIGEGKVFEFTNRRFDDYMLPNQGLPARVHLVGGHNVPTPTPLHFNNINVIRGDYYTLTGQQIAYNNYSNAVTYMNYVIPEDGAYKLNFIINAKANGFRVGDNYEDFLYCQININGTWNNEIKSGLDEDLESNFYRQLNKGDVITLRFFVNITRNYKYLDFGFTKIEMSVFKTNLGNVSFEDALKDLEVTTFFKDFLWRYGLTAIANNQSKTIHLQTFNEKIQQSNAVDWSDKFVERTSESYDIPTFGQRSLFTHKYNEDNKTYNDGVLNISNSIIDESKTVIASKIYSANQGFTNLHWMQAPILPIWQSEVKANSNGTIEVNYKSLSERFYYVKENSFNSLVRLTSDILGEFAEVYKVSVANVSDVHFNSLVPKYYGKQSDLLNVFKVHAITLNLSIFDIINVDMSKIYYIKSEGQYYILNKLSWQPGELTKGEFIRVIL